MIIAIAVLLVLAILAPWTLRAARENPGATLVLVLILCTLVLDP